MERVLRDGDYVPDGAGGLSTRTGGEEALARVLFRLTARRGGLPFLPDLGSRLYQLSREKPSARQSLPRPCGRSPSCGCGRWSGSLRGRRGCSPSEWTGRGRPSPGSWWCKGGETD